MKVAVDVRPVAGETAGIGQYTLNLVRALSELEAGPELVLLGDASTRVDLLPIGQLDGGHLLYAITPRYHRTISLLLIAAMVYAGFRYFSGWLLFAVLIFFALGTKHPRPLSFQEKTYNSWVFG